MILTLKTNDGTIIESSLSDSSNTTEIIQTLTTMTTLACIKKVTYHVNESISQEDYERELAERQKNHLNNIVGNRNNNWRPCMHDQCTSCHGTGITFTGGPCIHGISCPCPKCTPTY